MEKLTEKNNVIQFAGLWRIVLPDDKHPEVTALPDGTLVHRTKYIKLEEVLKDLDIVNEWYRQRGGRPKVTEYMPELKVDKRRRKSE